MGPQGIQPIEFFLKPGYIVAHSEDTLIRCVLGSCVAVTMYDPLERVGGINHFVWPRVADHGKATPMCGEAAIPALFNLLQELGASPRKIEAQIFGGGMPPEEFGVEDDTLGAKNLEVARQTLKRLGVPVMSEDVGGCKGRKVLYHTVTNEAVIIKVDKLRATDWYRPGQDIDWDRV